MTKTKDPASAQQGREISSMFGRIAGWYDFLNHFLSLGIDKYWRYRLARAVRNKGQVLDLAAGTLDCALEICRQNDPKRVVGLDLTLGMLKKGQAKIERRGYDRILPVCGDAISLPLPDDSFDCVSMAFGIRNIEPRQRAYAEMYRVLAPGGRLCLLEFGSSQDRIWKGLYNTYLHLILPLAGRMISKDPQAYNYLARTIQGFPKAPFLARELVAAGFERLGFLPLQSGIVYLYIAEKPGWG